jgi:hypothetical protein
VINVVAQCDLAQRLASCHTLQGFACLVLGQAVAASFSVTITNKINGLIRHAVVGLWIM